MKSLKSMFLYFLIKIIIKNWDHKNTKIIQRPNFKAEQKFQFKIYKGKNLTLSTLKKFKFSSIFIPNRIKTYDTFNMKNTNRIPIS